MEEEINWKERYGHLRIATEQAERRCHEYRVLIKNIYHALLDDMIDDAQRVDDVRRAALYARLKTIESALATIDPRPRTLKSKL